MIGDKNVLLCNDLWTRNALAHISLMSQSPHAGAPGLSHHFWHIAFVHLRLLEHLMFEPALNLLDPYS